jgi:type II secretory pathway pseudopilin PulG
LQHVETAFPSAFSLPDHVEVPAMLKITSADNSPKTKVTPRTVSPRAGAIEFATIAAYGGLTALILVAIALLLPPVQRSRTAARRSQCKNNLKQIGLALHNYHDTFGCFPPAYIADEYGRPMHSWRVLILPYIDQALLYNQYRFDEPWDGPNNSRLADRIGNTFLCPSDPATYGEQRGQMTNYVAILGPDTAWPDSQSVKLTDIQDGTSNTILVVEVAHSDIHWMEPRDLDLPPMKLNINPESGPGASSGHTGGIHALLGDGSVRFLSDTLPEPTFRALLTIHGGEKIGDY